MKITNVQQLATRMKKENGLLDVAMNGYEGIKVFEFVVIIAL